MTIAIIAYAINCFMLVPCDWLIDKESVNNSIFPTHGLPNFIFFTEDRRQVYRHVTSPKGKAERDRVGNNRTPGRAREETKGGRFWEAKDRGVTWLLGDPHQVGRTEKSHLFNITESCDVSKYMMCFLGGSQPNFMEINFQNKLEHKQKTHFDTN
jgi:hypothetical protein